MDGETILEEDIEAEIAKLEKEADTLNTEDGESLTGKASMDDNIEKELAELENTKPDYIEKTYQERQCLKLILLIQKEINLNY